MAEETQALSPEKQTLLALRALRRRVEELEQTRREPIAIVGVACRLPGGIDDPEAYWNLLAAQRSAVTEIPQKRLDLDSVFDPRPQTPGKTYSRRAGLLAAPGDFDAEFFGISPREALSADPQQRLLLEASWEALEDAGIDPKALAGADVGVFVGIGNSEYARHYRKCVPKEELAAHSIQGSALNAAAGRLSYFFGFAGPSLAIDTACSSSLVAVDRACRSLLERETDLALAGGVNLLADPEALIAASQWGMLSPTGACRAFDAAADGFVRGEGCGIVVLKRLRDAEAAGDRILGAILGSAVNQDGASSGLTVPNGQAQQRLLQRALANAGVEAWQVGYVEAHGTGTALGDPIEAAALGTIFGAGKTGAGEKRERPLPIGSVKTNLGHLESAAGIAGLIKLILGLRHKTLPAQLYWERPSEHVQWDELPLEVVTEARPWEAIDGRRIGGVSSFGFSGTNAHVVVEGLAESRAQETRTRPAEVLVLTARTEPALRSLAARYAEFLEQSGASWGEICHTAAMGRAVFAERLAVVAEDKAEAAWRLRAWLGDETELAGVSRGRVRPGERVRVGVIVGRGWGRGRETADLSTALRSGRDDKEGVDSPKIIPAFSPQGGPQAHEHPGEGRSQAWRSKLRSWGVDPVVVVAEGQDAAQEMKAAGATVALVLGEAEPGFPAVQLREGWRELAGAIAELFVRGVRIDWSAWEAGLQHRRVQLPTYAFQRERYWITPQRQKSAQTGEATGRKLLGMRLRAAGVRGQYESKLAPGPGAAWLAEHLVAGRAVLPATGHLELMLEAGADVRGAGPLVVEDMVLQAPLSVERERTVQTVLDAEAGGRSRVRIYARVHAEAEPNAWQVVSEGWIRNAPASPQPTSLQTAPSQSKPLQTAPPQSASLQTALTQRLDLALIRERLKEQSDLQGFYAAMAARGMEFGESFRGLRGLWIGEGEALGKIGSAAPEEGYAIAPWRLDACLQIASALMTEEGASGELYLPLSAGEFALYGQPGEECWSHVRMRRIDDATLSAEVAIGRPDGSLLARFDNLRFRKSAASKTRTAIYGVEWTGVKRSQALNGAATASLEGHWLVLADGESFATEIVERIGKQWGVCSLVLTRRDPALPLAGAYCLPAGGEQGLAPLLRELVAAHGPLAGVVHLSTTGTMLPDEDEPPAGRLEALHGYDSALCLLQTLIRGQMQPADGVWFVTRNAEQTDGPPAAEPLSPEGLAIRALRRTAALEFPALRTHAVDLAGISGADELLRAIETQTAPEIVLRNGAVLEPRLVERRLAEDSIAEENNRELRPAASGLIDDLVSVAAPRTAPKEDEVEIYVQAHGLNFRDVMNALGMLPGMPQHLGGECAGVVRRAGARSGFQPGDRVFALAPRSFSTFVTVPARNVRALPQGLDFADAAVLPVAYLTALYGLERLAKLQKGERILIHSASGGLGLAAVFVARARGAEVYATAGSEEKRAYLRSLGIEHVFHSRTTDFASEVMRATAGRGVDVVLNSLTGALAESTLAVLANGGRFLEVGKRDVLTTEQVHQVRPDVQHFMYDLGEELEHDPALAPELLADMARMLESGEISRLPVTEFDEPRDAFRFMAQARHIGKISVRGVNHNSAKHAIAIDPTATYLITGGCGGLGLHFAAWLVDRGARHLLLASRRPPGASAEKSIAGLRAAGADVQVARVDVSDGAAMRDLLGGIPKGAPLKGVLHAAGVAADHSLLNQSIASFVEVARPKWLGAMNLHRLTRAAPLDFFVLFSSASALLGVPGQANYAAANAMLDALAAYRRRHNLPALCVQWGPWSTGMTESLHFTGSGSAGFAPANFGFGWITPEDGTRALEGLLTNGEATAAVLPVESWAKFVSRRPPGASSLFASVIESAGRESAGGESAGRVSASGAATAEPARGMARIERTASLVELLERATPSERRRLLLKHLSRQTAQILSLPPHARIDEETALHDLGVDSLMAVELRNALQLSLNRQLSPTLALDYPTLRALCDILLKDIFGSEKPDALTPQMTDQTTVRKTAGNAASRCEPGYGEIDDLSESEAEALLLLELEKAEPKKTEPNEKEMEKAHAAKH